MPSRQINEFSQKGNRKKIELVARPGLKKFGDQYLKVLDDDRTRFLDRVGDAGGGQYVINVKVWSLNKWLV